MNQVQSEFSFGTALALLESSDRFPVDFDTAWQWLGYHRKDAAKEKLTRNFERGFDYSVDWRSVAHSNGYRASRTEIIMLSTDCFKQLGMMAGTEKGKQVRRYFLECERKLKQMLTDDPMLNNDSTLLRVLEHRVTARFEQRFAAIEQRLEHLESQLNRRSKPKLAGMSTNDKYLYSIAPSVPEWRLIFDFLEGHKQERFSAQELAQMLSMSYNSIRRLLPAMCRQGLARREFNTEFNSKHKGVSKYFYRACD